MISDT